jgi:hypothetical protein
MRGRWVWSLVVVGLSTLGCGDGEELPVSGASIYVAPASLEALSEETFFDHPWPSDLRYEADGTVRFEGYPNPRKKPILKGYVSSMKGVLHGFSPAAAGFVRFTTALAQGSLPTPRGSLSKAASVQLIDVDPASPERGQRQRVATHFRAEEGAYWQQNTLAFMPALGHPLRPSTRYALVVTERVRAADGGRIEPSPDLRVVLDLEDASGAAADAKAALAGALSEVERAGIAKGSIVHLAVFTTNDPTEETAKIRDWVLAEYAPPKILDGTLTRTEEMAFYDTYDSRRCRATSICASR